MADLVTAIGTGRKSDNPATGSVEASDADKTASASPDNPDNLVALVLARPEINSLSDLNNKNIAIEEKQSASSGRVSAALMAAGAAEVQFSEGKAGAIDRLISGEVRRGPDAGFARSRRVVSRYRRLQDISGSALAEGATLTNIARVNEATCFPRISLRSSGYLHQAIVRTPVTHRRYDR